MDRMRQKVDESNLERNAHNTWRFEMKMGKSKRMRQGEREIENGALNGSRGYLFI